VPAPPPTRAARYEAFDAARDHAADAAALLELLRRVRGDVTSILDVGCGPGQHLEAVLARDPALHVRGVDLDPDMVALAAARIGVERVAVADMMDLNLDETFDAVICLTGTICLALSVDGLGRAMRSMARCLGPAGVLAIEPYHEPWRWRAGAVRADTADGEGWALARIQRSGGGAGGAGILEESWLLGTAEGIEAGTDCLRVGLFEFAQIREAFEAAGLRHHYDPSALAGRALHVGTRVAPV
jgi:SAM-dependent methyltransferase